jgi:hypothetical protein
MRARKILVTAMTEAANTRTMIKRSQGATRFRGLRRDLDSSRALKKRLVLSLIPRPGPSQVLAGHLDWSYRVVSKTVES